MYTFSSIINQQSKIIKQNFHSCQTIWHHTDHPICKIIIGKQQIRVPHQQLLQKNLFAYFSSKILKNGSILFIIFIIYLPL